MDIKPRSSTEQVIASGKKYTGLCNMKVVAINPSLSGLKALGINATKEPNYFTEFIDQNSGEKRTPYRVEAYLQSDHNPLNVVIKGKLAFFIENVPSTSQGGSTEWINKYGQHSYPKKGSPSGIPPQYDWFKLDDVRPAIVGEAGLTDFIIAWANLSNEDSAQFSDPSEIAKGNLQELMDIWQIMPKDNEVKVLLGVDKKGYQQIYTKFFGRANVANTKIWKDKLSDDYGKFKTKDGDVDWGNSFVLREWVDSEPMQPNAMDLMGGQPGGQQPMVF